MQSAEFENSSGRLPSVLLHSSVWTLHLCVGLVASASVPPRSEECSLLLLVEPAKELLESRIPLNLLDRVELVAQFVMRPRFVDEILAGVAGRSDVPSAFAARHDMVPSRGHVPVAECAGLVHTVGPKFLWKDIHSCDRLKVSNRWLVMPLRKQFHILTPAEEVQSSGCKVQSFRILDSSLLIHNFILGRSFYFAFRGSKVAFVDQVSSESTKSGR